MAVTPSAYNAAQLASGALTIDHVTELVRYWQAGHGLTADGKAGTGETIPSIVAALPSADIAVVGNWITGPGVTRVAAHPSWFGGALADGRRGVVAHYTDTDAGTAIGMATRRTQPYRTELKPSISSWHITIETDGSIVVMVPLDRVAFHAGSPTAQPIPSLGNANSRTYGIELVGRGKGFPAAQVASAKAVWRALVRRYGILREHAMITHQSIDPTRRDDPGPVWMGQHAADVLDYAYA